MIHGLPATPYTLDLTIGFMQRHNITHSILSCPIPLTTLNLSGSEITSLSREINEYLASLRSSHPTEFGFFATLPPLTDTAAAIAEINYALVELKADGVILFTSYEDKYPGHADFTPIWEALELHSAVVFVHPTIEDMSNIIKDPIQIPRPIVDWTHEISRAALNLITSNKLNKYPGVRVILSHGGGTLPYIAFRAAELSQTIGVGGKTAEQILEEAKTFYFDTAFVGFEGPAQLLEHFAKPGRILFGSDFPYGNDTALEKQNRGLGKINGLGDGIGDLFPRLKGHEGEELMYVM